MHNILYQQVILEHHSFIFFFPNCASVFILRGRIAENAVAHCAAARTLSLFFYLLSYHYCASFFNLNYREILSENAMAHVQH